MSYQYRQIAKKHMKEGNYHSALNIYTSALMHYPNNVAYLIGKANAQFHINDYHGALETYFQAIQKKKKIGVFIRFINQTGYKPDDWQHLLHRLHNAHNLFIEKDALPHIVSYIIKQMYQQHLQKNFDRFKRQFEKRTIRNLSDYIDEYLWTHLNNLDGEFHLFCQLLRSKGCPASPFWLWNTLLERHQNIIQLIREGDLARLYMMNIDKMDGFEFEDFMDGFFTRRGYIVEKTNKTGDMGGDLILRTQDGLTIVQCKRWNDTVGVKAVQEVHTARDLYGTNHALVVATSSFSDEAIDVAKRLQIDLWDRDTLIMELQQDFSERRFSKSKMSNR